MFYNLSNPFEAAQADARYDYLKRRGSTIELLEKKGKRRTSDQNALLHLWLAVIADHCGYTDRERCKRDVKRTLLGTFEDVNLLTGETIQSDYHTSQMTVQELSAFMDRLKAWAQTDLGIYLPYWKDAGYEEMYQMYKNR